MEAMCLVRHHLKLQAGLPTQLRLLLFQGKGWNRYGSIAIISDIGNIGRLEDPIRYHFWMQEYRAQYITILSGASRAVKSTIKTPFFAYILEKLLGNQKHSPCKM